ncbi:MAG: N-acetylglutaminylglutamine synthetase [Hyphomicrobiaceae bacterium]|nr:N-acetylglutaminylglutamine synthetase [Hyphomicrobiaceae bacterium]
MSNLRSGTTEGDKGVRGKTTLKSGRVAKGSKAKVGARQKKAERHLPSVVDCGWGRLIFGQTFDDPRQLADSLQDEQPGRRDIAFYVAQPHLVLAQAPQALFLDPSHTFRLDLDAAKLKRPATGRVSIRKARRSDEAAINAIYSGYGMVPLSDGYIGSLKPQSAVRILIAEDKTEGRVIGVVIGVDHKVAFDDPENGASLWALAVDPRTALPGVGQSLVLALAATHQTAGRSYMDLSVMHNNTDAIALYEKLGFTQQPVFAVKMKNTINERLFIGPQPTQDLNIYATIIIDEARRRGIAVDIEDAESGLFRLALGGRSICCRESLSDLTSAVAMSRCDDKALTHRLLDRAGLSVPRQEVVQNEAEAFAFLDRFKRVVVKPARGEQGQGVAVDLRSRQSVAAAFRQARDLSERVLAEEFVTGEDLRIIVIGGNMVAAAIRKPASIIGDGKHAIMALIDKQSRRRSAATKGESRIPLDAETERCVRQAGHSLHDVLAEGETLVVRKTANLHTGGTIHDVTEQLHPELAAAACKAAAVLDMPVVGFDLIVKAPDAPDYCFIEANERPGLANHEPAPTAERFVDLLFPQTKAQTRPSPAAPD